MGLFNKFKKQPQETNSWDMKDINSFIVERNNIVAEKCCYGDNMAALNGAEIILLK